MHHSTIGSSSIHRKSCEGCLNRCLFDPFLCVFYGIYSCS
uniref:Uncharacterized protein n=1 Tax=Arundo donax TaxID=35708 RepID=A0A0A9CHY6_ARUDO